MRTIYQALKDRLEREPSNEELRAEVARIIAEGAVEGQNRKATGRRAGKKTAKVTS